MNDKLILTPSARYDHNSYSGSNVSGGLNFLYAVTDNVNVKGGIERKIYIDFSEEFDMDNVAKLITKFGTKIKFH